MSMKIIVLIVCLSVVCARADDFYVFSPDEFAVPEKLRASPSEIKERLDCFIGYAPCTPHGDELKKVGLEIVENACARCSPLHKEWIRVFLEGVRERFPAEYKQLRLKYDPTGSFFDRLADAVGI